MLLLTAKLVDFVGGLIDLAAISKAYCQRRVAALFEGKQPCFSSDATAGGLQQLLRTTPKIYTITNC